MIFVKFVSCSKSLINNNKELHHCIMEWKIVSSCYTALCALKTWGGEAAIFMHGTHMHNATLFTFKKDHLMFVCLN